MKRNGTKSKSRNTARQIEYDRAKGKESSIQKQNVPISVNFISIFVSDSSTDDSIVFGSFVVQFNNYFLVKSRDGDWRSGGREVHRSNNE